MSFLRVDNYDDATESVYFDPTELPPDPQMEKLRASIRGLNFVPEIRPEDQEVASAVNNPASTTSTPQSAIEPTRTNSQEAQSRSKEDSLDTSSSPSSSSSSESSSSSSPVAEEDNTGASSTGKKRMKVKPGAK